MPPNDVFVGERKLPGFLTVPKDSRGLIIFAHGSGSSRWSPRNALAARSFEKIGFATLLFDLLSEGEAVDRRNVFDIPLLAGRIVMAIDWARSRTELRDLPIGLFGASTGGGAAIMAAASSPSVRTVVSRGGRPDLAGAALSHVHVPTLLVVGGADTEVLALNRSAQKQIGENCKLVVVPGAGHLFEEPGALEHVLAITGGWFSKELVSRTNVSLPFSNREAAGLALAEVLARRGCRNPVVYALPRGGIPVALPVAQALSAPMDILMVRKIGVPWHPELAAASVVDGEDMQLIPNEPVLRATRLDEEQLEALARTELAEIERRRAIYLPDRKPVPARGRTAILVDDGIATGTSMRAAIAALRKREPAEIIVAVPVAAPETAQAIGRLVDDLVVLAAPDPFRAVGLFYDDFHQLTDEEVIDALGSYLASEMNG